MQSQNTAKLGSLILAASALAVTSGCELLHENEGKKFAEETVKRCSGVVSSFTLVPSSSAKNQYEGLAKIEIDGEEYDLSLLLKAGAKGSIIETDDDPCTEHKVRKGLQGLLGIFNSTD